MHNSSGISVMELKQGQTLSLALSADTIPQLLLYVLDFFVPLCYYCFPCVPICIIHGRLIDYKFKCVRLTLWKIFAKLANCGTQLSQNAVYKHVTVVMCVFEIKGFKSYSFGKLLWLHRMICHFWPVHKLILHK